MEKAYEQIRDELGIPVLRLNYIPEGMRLLGFEIKEGYARMEFTYEINQIYVLEVSYPVKDSSTYSSDCKTYDSIFNEWIGREIPIQKNKIGKTDYEYSSYFSVNDTYYMLVGVMKEEEFFKIIESVVIEY